MFQPMMRFLGVVLLSVSARGFGQTDDVQARTAKVNFKVVDFIGRELTDWRMVSLRRIEDGEISGNDLSAKFDGRLLYGDYAFVFSGPILAVSGRIPTTRGSVAISSPDALVVVDVSATDMRGGDGDGYPKVRGTPHGRLIGFDGHDLKKLRIRFIPVTKGSTSEPLDIIG